MFGPGTFLNKSVTQIADGLSALTARQTRETRRAGRRGGASCALAGYSAAAGARRYRKQAEEVVDAKFLTELLKLACATAGHRRAAAAAQQPAVRRTARIRCDSPAGTPKTRFASIFPGKDGALIQVRLRDGLSESQRRAAIADIRAAVAMPRWQLSSGAATASRARR